MCGVAGNGQRELAEAICATRPRDAARSLVDGRPTTGGDPRELIEAGVAHIPEDRLHIGLAASASIEDNLVLKSYRKPPIVDRPVHPPRRGARQRDDADRALRRQRVRRRRRRRACCRAATCRRCVLARELSAEPKVVIAASPTRGLDVGAIETVRGLLLDVARPGAGVLLITEELEEAIALAGRILVIYEGRIVGEVDVDCVSSTTDDARARRPASAC